MLKVERMDFFSTDVMHTSRADHGITASDVCMRCYQYHKGAAAARFIRHTTTVYVYILIFKKKNCKSETQLMEGT